MMFFKISNTRYFSDTVSGSKHNNGEDDIANCEPQNKLHVRSASENYCIMEAHDGEVNYIQNNALVEHFCGRK